MHLVQGLDGFCINGNKCYLFCEQRTAGVSRLDMTGFCRKPSMNETKEQALNSESIDIAFVGGWGRSGSTLLSRMLGEVPDFVAVGEVRDVFLRGIMEDRVCGCGSRFSSCEFWQEVGDNAYGGWSQLDVQRLKDLRVATDKPWHVPALLKPGLREKTDHAVEEYGNLLLQLYRSIKSISGCNYIVDASKIASYGAILHRTDGLDPHFIHLVRDPRGTLNSWMKQVHMTDDLDRVRYMPRYNSLSGIARYLGYNAEMHAVGRKSEHMLMRYEDLVSNPEENIRLALSFLGADDGIDLSQFINNEKVNLGMNHTIAGNPMRHSSGWIELKPDNAWQEKLSKSQQLMIGTLSYPLLKKYKYSVFAG